MTQLLNWLLLIYLVNKLLVLAHVLIDVH